MMSRGGGGGMGIAIAGILLIAIISGFLFYNTYFSAHPIQLPTVSNIVTLVTDSYGHARAYFTHAFNATLNTPNLQVFATVHTNTTSLENLAFQASLQLGGAEFSFGQPHNQTGPDETLFTWDITVLHFSPGLLTLIADVLISLVSCGQCRTTTFKVPVELAMTVNE